MTWGDIFWAAVAALLVVLGVATLFAPGLGYSLVERVLTFVFENWRAWPYFLAAAGIVFWRFVLR